MRTILFSLVMVGLFSVPASAIDVMPRDNGSVVLELSSSSGMTDVTVRDLSDEPFTRSVFRLVPLPAGADNVRLDPLGDEASGVSVTAERPMILRGLRVLPLRISPTPDAGPSPLPEFELKIRYDETAHPMSASRSVLPHSRGFFAPYAKLFGGTLPENLPDAQEGSYLIITDPEFETTLNEFVAWKREMGYVVDMATTAETGITIAEIQAHIGDKYANSPIPPQYVLLVGDIEQVPAYDFDTNPSDLPYVMQDGDDFLPDLLIGRFSAQSTEQLETIVAKTMNYEQDPFMDDPDWFTRGLVVAGNSGSSTPVPVSKWGRRQLLEMGFTDVEEVYYPPHWSTGRPYIISAVDEGVSIVTYRGWAYGWQGWQPPTFTVDDIPALDNGWKLPLVCSFVCLNNDFVEPECFGEAWIRAGSATQPKGAVAFIGNSEGWSHTRFNDAAAIGTFNAIKTGTRRLGDILHASKFEILEQFSEYLYADEWADNSVEFYFYVYSLLGDPALELRLSTPRDLVVTYPDVMALGANYLEITVAEADSVTPVANARVGVTHGSNLIGCVFTGDDGTARILHRFETSGTLNLTVTGADLLPHRGTFDVATGTSFLTLHGDAVIDDDEAGGSQGNGDQIPNPGELLEITATLQNLGGSVATNVSATLEAVHGAVVESGSTTFPDIQPGGTGEALTPFVVRLDEKAEDQLLARLRLDAVTDGEHSFSGLDLIVEAPQLQYSSLELGDDGVLDPGESTSIIVTIENVGSLPASAMAGILRTATPNLVSVVDSMTTFDTIDIGESGTGLGSFTIEAADDAAIGQAAVFTLDVTTEEGYVSQTSFSFIIGQVDARAPFGPDAYGYYAYDNSDTEYPDGCMSYDWIRCSENYGGSGTLVDVDSLGDNGSKILRLPFTFTFYGVDYDSLLVHENGWVSFELTGYYDYYNWHMPNRYGNGAQIAVFWDNLDVRKSHNGQPVGDGVYYFNDVQNHRYVVEWSRIGNFISQHQDEDRPDYDDLQTFELVLYDPAYWPTPTGDGIVQIQYRRIVNNDDTRMYSTVGIENETEDIGLEYTYANVYAEGAVPLSSGLSVTFSTIEPRYSPFELKLFSAVPEQSGVHLAWEPCDDRDRGTYRVYRASPGGEFQHVPGGILAPDARSFIDRGANPGRSYTYRIGSTDLVGRETLLGPFSYEGHELPHFPLALRASGVNPFRGMATLSYSIPHKTFVRLAVYDVTGRLIRKLVDRPMVAGEWVAHWDGSDERGHIMPSGIYFLKLDAGGEQRRAKLTLVR